MHAPMYTLSFIYVISQIVGLYREYFVYNLAVPTIFQLRQHNLAFKRNASLSTVFFCVGY